MRDLEKKITRKVVESTRDCWHLLGESSKIISLSMFFTFVALLPSPMSSV